MKLVMLMAPVWSAVINGHESIIFLAATSTITIHAHFPIKWHEYSPGERAEGFSLWCDLGSGKLRWPTRGSASGCLIGIMTVVNTTMIMMLTMMLLLLLLLPSAMHCGNFARFSSFLNKGTMTSSTRAQNCSDHNNYFDILGLQHLKEQYSPPNNCQLMSGWSSRDDNEGTMNVEYNHRVSLDGYRHMSCGWAVPARWCPQEWDAPNAWQSKPLCSCINKHSIYIGMLHLQKKRMSARMK